MNKGKIHIVCFAIPYPVEHGGMFDLFFKLVALYEKGVRIILHCFEYGKGRQPELNKYCEKVYYYPRKTGIKGFSLQLPYIVSSRISEELVRNLKEDDAPILMEGIHTSYLLYGNQLPGRKIFLRLHNIEHIYYGHLFRMEQNPVRKMYYGMESRLLKNYEKKAVPKATAVLTVSEKDASGVKELWPGIPVQYLPVFLPFQDITIKEGTGNYMLYHGNLSIAENEKAVIQLISHLYKQTELPLVIAGRNPRTSFSRKIDQLSRIRLIPNPSDTQLEKLISEAHINIVYSLNATGIKLKLLHALFKGRHCLANEAAIPDDQLKDCCHMVNSRQELISQVNSLSRIAMSSAEIEMRKHILHSHFNNSINAEKLIEVLKHYQ